MKILLTAFEPFGGDNTNSSLNAMNMIPNQMGDVEIIKLLVPTVFYKSIKVVFDAIAINRPNAVLCLGQAGGRGEITPERVAINIDDARIPDNEGNQPVDVPIFADGDTAYFSTLPIKEIVNALRAEGIPASVSNTAGTYVCNHLMYGVLYLLHKNYPNVCGGFMHVPSESKVNDKGVPTPGMDIKTIARGIEIAIETINRCSK